MTTSSRTSLPPKLPVASHHALPSFPSQGAVLPATVTIELGAEARYFGRDRKPYHPDRDLVAAANAALILEMPLLLAGEPGCGKTHFAWALAGALFDEQQRLGMVPDRVPVTSSALPLDDLRLPLVCYVRSDTRARDLLYRYDAVRRFGDAQEGGKTSRDFARDARAYVQLEGLGLALQSPVRRVVLIDEIDKAPRDLPNDLLNELDDGEFDIPEIPVEPSGSLPHSLHYRNVELRRHMTRSRHIQRPLVVITSNAERQLPEPFLRRCVFFHIQFPAREQLCKILHDHLDIHDENGSDLSADAVHVVLALREQPLTKKPATAELLSWVQAMVRSSSRRELTNRVHELATALKKGEEPSWSKLPLPGCLLKLHEDWIALDLRPRLAT